MQPPRQPVQSPRERREWFEQRFEELRTKGLAFYETYPTDPRRWTILLEMIQRPPTFIRSYGPDFGANAPEDYVVDEALAAAWEAKLIELQAALAQTPDAPAELRQAGAESTVSRVINRAFAGHRAGKAVDWDALWQQVLALAARYPLSNSAANSAGYLLGQFQTEHTMAETLAVWRIWTSSPNQILAGKGTERLQAYESTKSLRDLTFTAADGRAVDLAKLRGKVVLIDFWATWCGPCKAELPNVKAAYAAYHDYGFEVVGIALENAGLKPADTPEQAAAKLVAARKVLLDFTSREDMPWPQYFDGKWWKTDVAVKYSVMAVPAMFLLDQQGEVVSIHARGPQLQAEIRRLLKIKMTARTDSLADHDYAAFEKMRLEKSPGTDAEMGMANYYTWGEKRRRDLAAAALAFYAAYPGDPRRWDLVQAITERSPRFITGFGPDVETKKLQAAIIDEPAKAAWGKQLRTLRETLAVSTDAPLAMREKVAFELFAADFRAEPKAKGEGRDNDFSGFSARFDVLVAAFAAADDLLPHANSYLTALEFYQPGASEPIWRRLVTSPNGSLRDFAVQKVMVYDRLKQPVEFTFIALDGRPVDVAKLRGKVVLVDFWQTSAKVWFDGLPALQQIYATYHDRGFEIVGIAQEGPLYKRTDTTEQKTAKLVVAQQKVADFVREHAMPWPQQFDGKGPNDEIALRYGLRIIPGMLLLDQQGRIVSTDARGAKLEAEVKRLLQL